MKKNILQLHFIPLLLLSSCAHDWSHGDSYRQGAVIALQAIDWHQTKTISTEKTHEYSYTDDTNGSHTTVYAQPRWHEHNTILGEHPTTQQVNTFFVTAIIANYVIANLLPPKYRSVWQYLSIGYQGAFVIKNYSEGIR